MTTPVLDPQSVAAPESAIGTMSMVDLFWNRVDRWSDRSALRFHEDGRWRSLTWREYGEAVNEIAAGLIALGVDPGDRVGILATNQVRWHEADVGVLSAGAASVPAYPTSASGQVAYVLAHSGSRLCFVADRDQLAKVLLRRHELPALEHVIVLDGIPDGLDDGFVMQLDGLRDLGRGLLTQEPFAVRERASRIASDAIATIVYTSGTTGPPKGAMLTHDNLRATIEAITAVVPIGPDDRFLSFLPLSHIAERTVSHFGQIVSGGETWFARSLSTIADDLRACRPTVFFAVPRVWEKLQGAILGEVADMAGAPRRLADSYLALAAARQADAGPGAPSFGRRARHRLGYWALDRVVGAKIRAQTGLDQARILVSGAAPIEPDLLRWFAGIGMPVAEVYGQTEDCGPTSLNPPGAIRIGSVGLPLPGVGVRIAADGEILVKGPTVCPGYFNDPQRTRELIDDDGWMHSGDLGRVDADGYLYVTGRKKDLIITSSGKNIAPQLIETRLQSEPLVSQAVVIGDGRSYLTALLGLEGEAVARWASQLGKIADFEALVADPDLREEITAYVDRVNALHAPIEQIKAWRIIPNELTVAAGELTPTLKVRRNVVSERYAALIDELYATPSAT
ncbi:MAG: AMP-dependent synthetase/ligase [Acidimicrobiales bacterium]